jgi:predicted Zn-dependent protease with MMP-like domain
MRSGLAPRAVPVSRTPSEVFDELVLDAVDELEEHWATELAPVEFAVEEVPPLDRTAPVDFDPEIVLDRGIPLGRLYRSGTAGISQPIVVLYRRPIEARAVDRDDRADLVFMIVAELVAELLGKDVDEIDPH